MSLTGDEGSPENLVNAYIAENIDLDDIDIHITGRMSTLTVLSELIVQSRRVREIAMISKEEDNLDKLVMHFRSPPEVKGTGFLMLESEAKSSTVSARRS